MSGASAESPTCFRVLVSGRVQGVAFRWHAVEQARQLGVDGWIQNLPDGRVEAWVQGKPPAVESMLAWLARGPAHARVDAVERHREQPGPWQGFNVRRGAGS
jgi:acylphosphatase